MNHAEFARFQQESGKVYVNQLMETSGLSREEAELKAKREGEKILPHGMETKGALFLTLLGDAEMIGYLWFQLREQGGGKTAFSYAFEIFPQAKGSGYFAMKKAREYLRSIGVTKVSLHVFAKNNRAVDLYQALGFQVDSYNMSAEL